MSDDRKVVILCTLLRSCNPSVEEVSNELSLIENRDRMVWETGKLNKLFLINFEFE